MTEANALKKERFEWAARVDASSVFVYSATLRRIVRSGGIADQRISNIIKIYEALDDRRFIDAAAYARVFLSEAKLIRGELENALSEIRKDLGDRGVSADDIRQLESAVSLILVLPDGTPYQPNRQWAELEASLGSFDDFCRQDAALEARAIVPIFQEQWRRLHDRTNDLLSGLLNEVVHRFGERAIQDTWVRLNESIFMTRYSQYDISQQPWADALDGLVYITFESTRGHLMGPARTGDCEFADEGDRWVWTWNPCGTCGRTIRGDDIEGTPPRMLRPYSWPVLAGAYDWSWNKAGISPYGVQACIKLEQMGIDRFGYPLRVVDCPTYPDGRRMPCVRYVYKDPTTVSELYYERVGRKKTSAFGSAARGWRAKT